MVKLDNVPTCGPKEKPCGGEVYKNDDKFK
jgi:hypothetical protein